MQRYNLNIRELKKEFKQQTRVILRPQRRLAQQKNQNLSQSMVPSPFKSRMVEKKNTPKKEFNLSKRTLDMLGFATQKNNLNKIPKRMTKKKPAKTVMKMAAPKIFPVNKACFTDPWGLAGSTDDELRQVIVQKLKMEKSPHYQIPKVAYENPEAKKVREMIIKACVKNKQTTETTFASLQLFNRVMKFSREEHKDKESAKLAESLHGDIELGGAGWACISIASKFYEVMPINLNCLMRSNVVEKVSDLSDVLCFKVFGMNLSQPSPQTFINLLMGAWSEDETHLIERLATIASFICLLDKDLLQFRTSVLAVASIQVCLSRMDMISELAIQNLTTDSDKTIKSIECRVYDLISAENDDIHGAGIGITLAQFKQQISIVKEKLNRCLDNRRANIHSILMMNKSQSIQQMWREMIGHRQNLSFCSMDIIDQYI